VRLAAVTMVSLGWSASIAGAEGQTPPVPANPQTSEQSDLRDVIRRYIRRDTSVEPRAVADARESRFFLFPTFGGNPATGFAMGALMTMTRYLGDPATTPLSSVVASTSFTTRKQVLIAARSDVYTKDAGWHLRGDWRFYRFTERTHGLGSDRPDEPNVDVDYDWYRIHQSLYRPVWADLEFGVGYRLDVHTGLALTDDASVVVPAAVPEEEAGTSSGLSVEVLFDNRVHPLNAERGAFGRASYTFVLEAFGSKSGAEVLELEGRAYHRLGGGRRQVLAWWGLGTFTRAGERPYFDLPSIGWDTYGRTGRGYRAGRFRGHDWVYTEVEYRVDLTRNGLLGAVAFVNASTLSGEETRALQKWVPGGGFGFRIKLDKERRSNISIDFGWGREGSKGVFLGLNEAF
jgi:hypothetical protein